MDQVIEEIISFSTLIWKTSIPEHVSILNKLSDPYIKEAINRDIKIVKKNKEIPKKVKNTFGMTHHSNNLVNDDNFNFIKDIIINNSNNFIKQSGFDIKDKKLYFSELWVQEFSKLGGGHHSTHSHWNQHVSGFYFLKASELTSFPRFYDPRPGAVMTKLPLADQKEITSSTEIIHYKVKPGDMIIFPGFLPHEFAVDHGIEPFRFMHWNIQYV